MQLVFFLIFFVSLFLLSRVLTSTISLFFYRITRSYTFAIHLLAILFLPGVIFHEIAHWLLASLLFVPTGDIEFLPQVQGDSVKLGSVQIAKADPFRRFVIGVAPIIFGLTVLLGTFWFLNPTLIPFSWKTLVFLYIVFEIGNTMFSSKKDIEGITGFIILFFLLLSFLFFLKVPLASIFEHMLSSSIVETTLQVCNSFFVAALVVDAAIVGLLRFFMKR